MKNWKQGLIMAVIAIVALTFTACSGSGGGKSINSATELKEYLDKQPANSPDQPIKVAMKANEMMIKDIAKVISEAGKYVSLNLSGSPLTEIPGNAFRDCKTLVGITISNDVTSIGDSAFNSTGLTSITIPNSVTSIESNTFRGTPLTSITIPNSVASIGGAAFAYTNLTSITIPNSVTSIGHSAFYSTSLTSITIPNSVTIIEGDAFYGCENLTSVTFQGTVALSGFYTRAFNGDLRAKYLAGGVGTYTTTAPVGNNSTWTKQ